MNDQDSGEFYVGYLPRAPRHTARQVRFFCLALIACAVVAAILFVTGQHKFLPSVFEFQQDRQFEGVIHEKPYPMLSVQRPGNTGNQSAVSQYLLVGAGKHGAHADVAGFDGRHVRLQGTLIYRDGTTMIEIVPHSVTSTDLPSNVATGQSGVTKSAELGLFTLVGEIVDSKCYLGVMNPGSTKPHRECAVRCISGGAPPLFIARDLKGRMVSLLLVSARGEPVNQQILDLVAEPVEITGQVVSEGEQLYLRANPDSYKRVQ